MLSATRPEQTQTRGVRVDGRTWSVDALENLLTFGQQESIFAACLDAAELRPGERMLDVGCGTGKLAIAAAKRLDGELDIHGIDATPGMIERAGARAHAAGVRVRFQPAIAERLPFPDGHFHAVVSTFTFHHFPEDLKRSAAREVRRVLAPGGRFILGDYGRPVGLKGRLASFPLWFNFYEYVRPQLKRGLERLLLDEGFASVEVAHRFVGFIPILRFRR